ncbi:hypothetical protein ES705_27079 [subsurface metagenome]
MDVCLICRLEEPAHNWDPTADRDLCMYPFSVVPQPHWIPICDDCRAMIVTIPNDEFYKISLRLARRQLRKINIRRIFYKERKIQ